jgi:mono/diheme cytochrome c family protein
MRVRAVAYASIAIALVGANYVAWRGDERIVTTTTEVRDSSPSARAAAAPLSDDQLVSKGRNLFRAKGCAACHLDTQVGPSLTNLDERAGKTRAGMSAEHYLRESIVAPAAFRASTASSGDMPTLPVDAAELDALIAYLLTL